MMPTANQAGAGAQPTRWSLVARVHEGSDEARMEALGELLQRYLPVLHWYLGRHPGLDAHRREDLVQGFVASKILEQSILERADRSRGRFRTFLLNAFQNYIRDEVRRASAARRPAAAPRRRRWCGRRPQQPRSPVPPSLDQPGRRHGGQGRRGGVQPE